MSGPPRLALALGLAAAGAIAVVVALALIGGPGAARLERLDEQRARDLVELIHAIDRYRGFEGRLPDSLGALQPRLSGEPPILDPQTGQPYEYQVLDGGGFRLCALLSVPGAGPAIPESLRLPESRRVAARIADPSGQRLCWEGAPPPA